MLPWQRIFWPNIPVGLTLRDSAIEKAIRMSNCIKEKLVINRNMQQPCATKRCAGMQMVAKMERPRMPRNICVIAIWCRKIWPWLDMVTRWPSLAPFGHRDEHCLLFPLSHTCHSSNKEKQRIGSSPEGWHDMTALTFGMFFYSQWRLIKVAIFRLFFTRSCRSPSHRAFLVFSPSFSCGN